MRNKLNEILDSSRMAECEIITQYVIYKTLINLCNYEVILYGAGSNIVQIIRWLHSENLYPKYIIDGDIKKAGESVSGVEVINPNQIKEKLKNIQNTFTFITTAYYKSESEQLKINKLLIENGLDKYYYLFDRDIYGVFNKHAAKEAHFWDYYNNREKLLWAFDIMSDDESKKILLEYIRVFSENDTYLLSQLPTNDKYWGTESEKKSLYKHLDYEVFVNCGSCIGDTIFRYLYKGYSFSKIYGFEGDALHIRELKSNISLLPNEIKSKIDIIEKYLGDENAEFKFDTFFNNKKVTLINMDIEGAELEVLKGAKEIIKVNEPVLAICVYHRAKDIWTIPEFIMSCSKNYSFYLRKYASFPQDISKTTELVLYAVPKHRLEK